MSNACRADLVREARAGLIPESDSIAEEVRFRTRHTARIICTAKNELGSAAAVSDEHAITNILADIRHYCDCKCLAFSKLHAAAYTLYMEDKAYENTWPGLSENL